MDYSDPNSLLYGERVTLNVNQLTSVKDDEFVLVECHDKSGKDQAVGRDCRSKELYTISYLKNLTKLDLGYSQNTTFKLHTANA